MNPAFNETPKFAVSLQLACIRYPRKSLYIKRGNSGRGQLGSEWRHNENVIHGSQSDKSSAVAEMGDRGPQ